MTVVKRRRYPIWLLEKPHCSRHCKLDRSNNNKSHCSYCLFIYLLLLFFFLLNTVSYVIIFINCAAKSVEMSLLLCVPFYRTENDDVLIAPECRLYNIVLLCGTVGPVTAACLWRVRSIVCLEMRVFYAYSLLIFFQPPIISSHAAKEFRRGR